MGVVSYSGPLELVFPKRHCIANDVQLPNLVG